MPEALAKTTSLTGVEMDATTAWIAALLYPYAHIGGRPHEVFKIAR
jgi:hypothetical protein